MTKEEREEAIKIIEIIDRRYATLDNDERKALVAATKALKQEPCEDCISREAVLSLQYRIDDSATLSTRDVVNVDDIEDLPPVAPQPKIGRWLRMSDLSEQEDDRYKCSRCGNVVHYTDKMNLYTFNSWCGRCGSDNGRHINQESEE